MLMDTTREMEEMQNELWMKRTTFRNAPSLCSECLRRREKCSSILCQKICRQKNSKNKSMRELTANLCPMIFSKTRIEKIN